MSFGLWLGFLLAAVLIAITPGPGAVLSMSIGMRYGYRSALRAILGLQAALLIQLVVVALGLGALLAASETAFGLLKLAGAAYLIWLGVQKWRAPVAAVVAASGDLPKRGLFVQGLLVNLTNPKAIVFIGALVPQFIDPAQSVAAQYAVIAATLCATDVIVMSGYAVAALQMGRWLGEARHIRWQNRIFGAVFVTAGSMLAVSSRH
ncbi:MAG: homoserine/homoserine lactone efflux protein [Dechloromonas sp.]|nr:MAG: homoserine/homoserine lactone efflux protein [Dechloromonas sp.]